MCSLVGWLMLQCMNMHEIIEIAQCIRGRDAETRGGDGGYIPPII